ncbi:MAG TPA: hypothetical protein DEO85_14985 [Maritimibacter sp.]|nr:hypothetical protein [Maritimibacter sp.]
MTKEKESPDFEGATQYVEREAQLFVRMHEGEGSYTPGKVFLMFYFEIDKAALDCGSPIYEGVDADLYAIAFEGGTIEGVEFSSKLARDAYDILNEITASRLSHEKHLTPAMRALAVHALGHNDPPKRGRGPSGAELWARDQFFMKMVYDLTNFFGLPAKENPYRVRTDDPTACSLVASAFEKAAKGHLSKWVTPVSTVQAVWDAPSKKTYFRAISDANTAGKFDDYEDRKTI